MYVEDGEFYFVQLKGSGNGGNDMMFATDKESVKIEDLKILVGVRMICNEGGKEKITSYLRTHINKQAADKLEITYATVSRIRKALGIDSMGMGGDRKSHKFYREAYQNEPEPA